MQEPGCDAIHPGLPALSSYNLKSPAVICGFAVLTFLALYTVSGFLHVVSSASSATGQKVFPRGVGPECPLEQELSQLLPQT
eukprot:CAMPEP_0204076950 /NCGR_PEP_ID=MMETSP0360-20130528/168638_1 /ASSEMBLY_ACC=CAM_ASM_000342 /TAXON_ID=268821 /ORGANISM="Scrippsiella Hangoei, Strain SHTV-5" /LENGTH=81 /DNA_ID=CAMNT_0051025527 /DNA_START=551 /DNA_END=796 /DNA_ORIENTATION=+